MVIVFGMAKGGVWKSTTVMNLAGVIANRGKSVCIIDADTRETCNNNVRRRNEYNQTQESLNKPVVPHIQCAIKLPEDRISRDLIELDKHWDYVLVDTGGYENNAFKSAAAVADIVYLPFFPCTDDMDNLTPTLKVLIETEDFIRNTNPEYTIDSRLIVTGSDHNSNDLLVEALEYSRDLLPYTSISGTVIKRVKKVVTLKDDGLTLADIKHPKRAMYEMLLDEIDGKREMAHQRAENNHG